MTQSAINSSAVTKINSPVLIIEDEGLMSALLKRYLSGSFAEKFGSEAQPFGVESFESGWDIIESDLSQVKVAVVDLLVPRLSGVDFLRHLKHKYPHISFIPISGMATEPMKRQVRELLEGNLKFLEKPLRREEFQDAFQNAWTRTENILKDVNSTKGSSLKIVQTKKDQDGSENNQDPEPLWTAVKVTANPKIINVKKKH